MPPNKLKLQRAQRQLHLDLVGEILTLAHNAVDDQSLHVRFKLRCSVLDELYSNFEKVHSTIVSMIAADETPDFEAEKVIRDSFFESFYTIKTIYTNLFVPSTAKSEQKETTLVNNSSKIKLQRLSIPTFTGDYKEWPSFRDLFRSLIHENSDLNPVEKFQYLVSVLSKEPLNIVKTLPLTEANYSIAFKSLTDRYENHRLLASIYWNSIYNLKQLTSPSSRGLRPLLDSFRENLAALKNVPLPKDLQDFMLFNLLIHKVDTVTRERFELEIGDHAIPTLSKLEDFLSKQCNALENVALASDKSTISRTSGVSSAKTKPFSSFVTTSKRSVPSNCNICKEEHAVIRCPSLLGKSPSERFELIKSRNLCLNCFGLHRVKNCQSKYSCQKCHNKHHSLLHFTRSYNQPTSNPGNAENTPVQDDPTGTEGATYSLANVAPSKQTILLATARVECADAWGNFQPIRALIDTGSQVNIISNRCLQRLGLSIKNMSLSIFGVGQTASSITKGSSFVIRPSGQPLPSFDIEAVVLPTICANVPNAHVSTEELKYISHIKLADPHFNIPGPVDLLIGAELFPQILLEGRLASNLSTAINTVFGWIVMGKVQTSPASNVLMSLLVSQTLEHTIKRFWELEEVPSRTVSSQDDIQCERLFVEKHSRLSDGRYCVALPFKYAEPLMGDSRTGALKQFVNLESRLQRDPLLYDNYRELMKNYLENGYMDVVTSPPINPQKVYYIPHHCVLNSSSSTTPVRVVFNASFKTVEGQSLNENLLIGPKLQKDIVSLLLNFRLHSVVFTADIKQMYLQVKVRPDHTDYQRIFWRFSPDHPIQEFRLTTVVFGVSSSPFLAIRTLLQLAQDESQYPLASKIIESDTYVDDIISGCSSLEEALECKAQLVSLLSKGKFELRKWASNDSEFLKTLPESLCQNSGLSFDEKGDSVVKVLGLKWIPSKDIFTYSAKPLPRPCSKRSILSELARIFDPLGFLAPLTFLAKHLIQHLWTLGLEWDQQPPADVLQLWNSYRSELPCLASLEISRQVMPNGFSSCQLHAFADSSEKGYAGVVFFRFELPNKEVKISLLCAKSKVAPLKRISLPRLELCAAVLASKLVEFVLRSYEGKISVDEVFAWSDSSIALSWIRSSPHRWKTFVSNRVSLIQDIVSPEKWHHISSKDNPADCASRGLLPMELLRHPTWWSGPTWLQSPREKWPNEDPNLSIGTSSREEERKIVLFGFASSLDCLDSLLEKYSSLAKIKRIVAYVLRFVSRCKGSPVSDSFTMQELHEALIALVKCVQRVVFEEVLHSLERDKPIPKSLRRLNPFVAEDGVLRVGGRLSNSRLSYDQKHPAILPRRHRLTELIIEEVHRDNMHPGLQTVQFLLLQNFWILSPRRAIRHVLSKCLRCFRTKPVPFQPPMGDLPPVRVSQVKPFQVVGVDFGGPFFLKSGRVRSAKLQKAYLCLFVCFATKALHLELASDMTTECFLAALRRFISRRGRCNHIYSDKGSNFVGARRELAELAKNAVESEKISWSFNPPSAPHFGGLWEAGIKSVKTHLRRVIGDQSLTYEEFYTVLVQIEAVLNSRPLCPLSSDPHDYSVLTPGHFLTLEPLTCVPDPDLKHLSLSHLSRWQLLQRLHQDFWHRWHAEYLHTLQQKGKWFQSAPDISTGQLVLIKNELHSPLQWRLGRVEQLHPGRDGVVRVATVRTTSGSYQRPLVKLCPLPNVDLS